jgi:hypothetical protein
MQSRPDKEHHNKQWAFVTDRDTCKYEGVDTDNVAGCEINLVGNKNEFADVCSHRTSDLHGEVNADKILYRNNGPAHKISK